VGNDDRDIGVTAALAGVIGLKRHSGCGERKEDERIA